MPSSSRTFSLATECNNCWWLSLPLDKDTTIEFMAELQNALEQESFESVTLNLIAPDATVDNDHRTYAIAVADLLASLNTIIHVVAFGTFNETQTLILRAADWLSVTEHTILYDQNSPLSADQALDQGIAHDILMRKQRLEIEYGF